MFTILLVTKCLYLYLLDDDTTQVEYHQFHEDDGTIYPSITFCFEWPIDLKESLWEQFLDSNSTDETKLADFNSIWRQYRQFLYGELYSKTFAKADYDTLTMDLNTFVSGYHILLNGNKWVKWSFHNGAYQIYDAYAILGETPKRTNLTDTFIGNIGNLNTYVSERRYTPKCFTFDTPWIQEGKIERIELWIRPQVFKSLLFQRIISSRMSPERFSVHYHYPHQKMASLTKRNVWRSEYEDSEILSYYIRRYYIGNVEV